jgi:GT2 family glycosyltransferase
VIVNNSPDRLGLDLDVIDALNASHALRIVDGHGNIGFSAGCNLGARYAAGQNLIFLNPDTVVYPGWTDALASHLLAGVGAVGPISNFVAGAQNWLCYEHTNKSETCVTSDDYAAAAQAIAGAKIHRGLQVKLLIGFCLMVPRSVWDTVGEFDPAFILGCDDLDYSLRVRNAGLKLIIAPDVFVYHEGHVSMREAGGPAELMNKASEAALRNKLRKAYGDQVPSGTELWGCPIFQTTEENGLLAYAESRADAA